MQPKAPGKGTTQRVAKRSLRRTLAHLAMVSMIAQVNTDDQLRESRDALRWSWRRVNIETIGTGCRNFGKGLAHYHPPNSLVEGRLIEPRIQFVLRPAGWINCPGPYTPGLRDLFVTTKSGVIASPRVPGRSSLTFDGNGIHIIDAKFSHAIEIINAPLDVLRELSGELPTFIGHVRGVLERLARAEADANAVALRRLRGG